MKSCAECALEAANKAYAKRHSTDVGHEIKTRRHVQDRIPGETPKLNWEEFLSLLRQTKDCVFELFATVNLDFDESLKKSCQMDAPKISWIIVHSVREQAGYRFK